MNATKVRYQIKTVFRELFPLLLGTELYYGIPAHNALENLGLSPKDKRRVFRQLKDAKLAVGVAESWKFAPQVLTKVAEACPAFAQKAAQTPSKTGPSLKALIVHYKSLLAGVPQDSKTSVSERPLMYFRKLCQVYDPEQLKSDLGVFVHSQQVHGRHDYSLQKFESWLNRRAGREVQVAPKAGKGW